MKRVCLPIVVGCCGDFLGQPGQGETLVLIWRLTFSGFLIESGYAVRVQAMTVYAYCSRTSMRPVMYE